MATAIDLEDTDLDLAGLYDRAARGEEIVIARGEGPKFKLVVEQAPTPSTKREFGSMRGQFTVPDSFFEPMTDDELRAIGLL